jgi:glycosyltransferase involved in cell wall biosynthesis
MRLLYLYSGGRKRKNSFLQNFQAPSEFFYGYWELSKKGVEVAFLDVPEESLGTIATRLLNYLYYRWQVLPGRVTGDLLIALYRLKRQLNNCDVIVATTTGIGFSLEILRRVGVVKVPVLTIHCGVMNNSFNKPTQALTGYLLRRGFTQVFGIGELIGMRQRYVIEGDRIELNEFGVDTRFWYPLESIETSDYLLSVGNDGRRDWDLLMQVAADLPVLVKVLTDRPPAWVPSNVEIIQGRMHTSHELPDTKLRELYRGALGVVVPLVDTLQPSGQSVTLQAMACAKAVVLTETKGLWNPGLLNNDENCILVPAADASEMKRVITRLLNESQWRTRIGLSALETVQKHWDIGVFSNRIEAACRRIHGLT